MKLTLVINGLRQGTVAEKEDVRQNTCVSVCLMVVIHARVLFDELMKMVGVFYIFLV